MLIRKIQLTVPRQRWIGPEIDRNSAEALDPMSSDRRRVTGRRRWRRAGIFSPAADDASSSCNKGRINLKKGWWGQSFLPFSPYTYFRLTRQRRYRSDDNYLLN